MSLRGLRVLILEDEPLIAVYLERAFRAKDAVPTMASSIEAGEVLLETGGFHACVLDLWLKGRYVDRLIDLIDRKGIPYAIYSGWSSPPGMRNAAYVAKPRPAEDVVAAIAAHLLKQSA